MLKTKTIKLLSEELNNKERIERKQIENICEACSKLIQQCNKRELKVADLKWQPQHSTVLKQLKSQFELILAADSSKSLDKLNAIPYLLCLKNNVFGILNSFFKFVIENSAFIGIKDHHLRRSFFVKVVHLQFLCHEIQAYFPGGFYAPSRVKISKLPAREWWMKKFGERNFVDLETFVNKFRDDYPFVNQAENFSFKNSINFTSTSFTTKFEFDLFTRLYSPWEIINEAWRIIYNHPAYLHYSTYGDTKDILGRHLDRPGTYVFRVSCKDLGFWTIGYVKGSKDMGQIKVDKTNLIEALVEGQRKNMYLYPNGEYTNPDLSNLNQYRKEIIVKNEELQLYECFEDFKECKICRESEKDLQLESCGHQICQGCFKMMRKYNKRLCPFCNQKILSTTRIVNIKNPAIPVGQFESENPNDHLYAEMSSDPNFGHRDSFGSVQTRASTLTQRTVSSLFSDGSDDFISMDFRSITQTDAPPRPPRSVQAKRGEFKNETNYAAPGNDKITDNILTIGSRQTQESSDNDLSADGTYSEPSAPEISCRPHRVLNGSLGLAAFESVHDPTDSAACNLASRGEQFYNEDVYSCPNEMSHGDHGPASHSNEYIIVGDTSFDSTSVANDDEIYASPKEDADDELVFNVTSPRLSDVLYSNLTHEDEYACDSVGRDCDLLYQWSERDVARALRVAENDRRLAREILREFVAID